jgi:hypothetical protein
VLGVDDTGRRATGCRPAVTSARSGVNVLRSMSSVLGLDLCIQMPSAYTPLFTPYSERTSSRLGPNPNNRLSFVENLTLPFLSVSDLYDTTDPRETRRGVAGCARKLVSRTQFESAEIHAR